MDNTIYTSLDSTIGYYKDIKDGYKDLIQDAIKQDDYETVEELTAQLKDIEDYKEYDGLLVLSMNNGFGFTCVPLLEADKLADEIKKALKFDGVELSDKQRLAVYTTIRDYFDQKWVS